jgi:DNA-binding HxlR family transcriptional regulator
MNDIKDEIKKSVEIYSYNNSIELGRVLGHKGALDILFSLKNGPKRFTDLKNELHLKKSTFENTLKELYLSVRLIRKIEAIIKNRDGHQYTLTSFGKEILSFIERYERFMLKPINQQTLFEVNKQLKE